MIRLAFNFFVIIGIAICSQPCFSADKDRPYVVIHRQGDFGCHTFRIPGIARTKTGTLLAVYDMRYTSRRDLQAHIDIGLSRSTDGGQTWDLPDRLWTWERLEVCRRIRTGAQTQTF